jgi:WD40 repeat protein
MIDSGGALAVLEHSTLLPDGRSAVGVGKGFGTWFFDADTGVAFCSLAALSRPVFALALTPDGRYLAEGGEDRKLRIYDLSSVRTYAGVHPSGSAGARDLDWSLDGSLLATAEDDGAIRLWDREGPRPRAPLGRHPAPAEAVRFSPDGALLASSGGGEVRLWDVSSGGERARDAVAAHALAWLSSRELLLGGDDGIRSRADGALRRIGDGRGVLSLAASRDGNGWAAGDSTGALTLFARDGAVLARNLAAHSDPIVSLAFSADGRTLASGGRDGAVRLWDTEALAPRGELLAYGAGAVNAVALAPPDSPAAGLLVASYAGGRTYFWDPNQDAPLLALGLQIPTSPGAISSRFSPDGSQVALLNAANALRIAPLAPSPRGSLQRLMKLYKYVPEGLDVMRAEEALVPPALQGKR